MTPDGNLADRVAALAREAGRAILEIYDRNGEDVMVSHKADDSPLTLADLAAHHIICAELERLTPELPIVSEEGAKPAGKRVSSDSFWLVDPLDGTREFIARNGEFTVNIALIRDGAPVFGVVYAPVPELLYAGGYGIGAWRVSGGRREAIHVAPPVSAGNTCRVVASKNHLNAETADFIARLGKHELIQAGSSLKFCRVAEGTADIYPRLGPTSEWDTAAAQAVVEAAGGFVYDLKGEPLRYGKDDILNPSFIAASVPLTALPGL